MTLVKFGGGGGGVWSKLRNNKRQVQTIQADHEIEQVAFAASILSWLIIVWIDVNVPILCTAEIKGMDIYNLKFIFISKRVVSWYQGLNQLDSGS